MLDVPAYSVMLILTPNPCLDVTIWVRQLVVGSVHRAVKNKTTAGGKGINVARAISSLGSKGQLILMLPKVQADLYKGNLAQVGISAFYLDIAGEVRKSIIVNQEVASDITVVNGMGPDITAEDWDRYCELVFEKISPTDLVLLMGSMPSNSPANAIEKLLKLVHSADAQLLVDTSPMSLKSRLGGVLDIITPNLEEAEAFISGDTGNFFMINNENIQERAMSVADKLQAEVAMQVFITAGEHGCAFNNGSEKWFLPAYKVKPWLYRSAVGAGDSFVAGLASYLQNNMHAVNWQDCARFAMATAAASCESFLAGGVKKERVYEILAGV